MTVQNEKKFSAIKTIVTDLDGTFLSTGAVIAPSAAYAYRSATEAGYKVIPATGRSRKCASNAIESSPYKNWMDFKLYPGVYLQGLTVFGPGGPDDIIFEQVMCKETIDKIFQTVKGVGMKIDETWSKPHRPFLVSVFCRDAFVVERRDEHCIWTEKTFKETTGIVADPSLEEHTARTPVNKFMLVVEEDEEVYQMLFKALEQCVGDEAEVVRTHKRLLEVMPKGASKGAGLIRLLDYLGLDPQETMALGDADNDIEMLKSVGLPIAVANASEGAKSVASFLTSSCQEDGFAKALETHLQIPMGTPSSN